MRQFKAKFETELRRDLSGYRKAALELYRHRATHGIPDHPRSANDIHTAISLKHNHLVNDFAHLIRLNDLLSQQGDLFG